MGQSGAGSSFLQAAFILNPPASEAIMPQFYREYFSNQCLFGLVFCD